MRSVLFQMTIEPVRIAVGKRPEHHALHQREHRGVGADAESQREDGDERKGAVAEQAGAGVANVLEEPVHGGV